MDINIDYDVRASPALEGVHAAETGADLRRGTEMGEGWAGRMKTAAGRGWRGQGGEFDFGGGESSSQGCELNVDRRESFVDVHESFFVG